MSSNLPAVSVQSLSKTYEIRHDATKHTTLAEALLHRFRHPWKKGNFETFCALSDVSFEIEQGEAIGILGRNGAGKSTLLKIMSRITEPTGGAIRLRGRVGSLLEVGTGFHPELTGRENVFLNGSILGMNRGEIKKRFDEIVDFAGTEKFLDTPVKRYSSGMYVRLAFAVAAHLQSDILLIDEVLSVGDSEFQRKCLGKMQAVANSGRTVIFVSHDMQSIASLCSKAVFLEKGSVRLFGPVDRAIETYLQSFSFDNPDSSSPDEREGTGEYRIAYVRPDKNLFSGAEEKSFSFRIDARTGNCKRMFISAYLYDRKGNIITHCDSRLVGFWFGDSDIIEGTFKFTTPWLKPGNYRVDVALLGSSLIDGFQGATSFEVSPVLPYDFCGDKDATAHGAVFSDFSWSRRAEAPLICELSSQEAASCLNR